MCNVNILYIHLLVSYSNKVPRPPRGSKASKRFRLKLETTAQLAADFVIKKEISFFIQKQVADH